MLEVALKFLNLDERQGLKEFRAIQRFKTIRYPHLASVTALWLLDETGKVLDDIGDGADYFATHDREEHAAA